MSVISSNLPYKDGNSWFKTVPLRAFLIKHELDINEFVTLNCSFGPSTNVGRCIKGRTLQRLDSTNVGGTAVEDWDKRRSSTKVGPVQTLDGYIYKEKRRSLVEVVKNKTIVLRNRLKIDHLLWYCDKIQDNWIKSHPLKLLVKTTLKNKEFEFKKQILMFQLLYLCNLQ